MSGYIGREQRTAAAEPVGVVDVAGISAGGRGLIAQQNQQLIGVLDSGARTIGRMADAQAGAEGETQGWADPMLRDANGQLTPPDTEQGVLLGTSENKRRGILAVRYGAEFQLENQAALGQLRAAHPADPEGFLESARGHLDGLMSSLPPAIRATAGEGLRREMTRNYAALQAERMAIDRQAAAASGVAAANQVLTDYQRQLQGDIVGGHTPAPPGSTPAPAGGGRPLDVPPPLMPAFQAAAQASGVPIPLLLAMAKQESNFGRVRDREGDGKGVMQVLDSTARDPGVRGLEGVDPAALRDPAANIMFGARYLAGVFPGTDWNDPAQRDRALKRYNGGGDPNYVQNVLRYLPGAQAAGPPPGAPAALAGYVNQLRGLAANGLMPPAEVETRIRAATVLMPIEAEITRQVGRMDQTEGRALVQTLLEGRGPGWRPEWSALAPAERSAMAREASQILSYRWATVQFQEQEQQRKATGELAGLEARLGGLQQRALDAAAGNDGAEPLTPAERGEMDGLFAKRTQLLVDLRNSGAGTAARAQGTLADVESRSASTALRGTMALEQAEALYGTDPEFQKLQDRLRPLRKEDRASIINDWVQQRAGERQAQGRAAAADTGLQAALALTGPPVANEPQNRAAAGRELARRLAALEKPSEGDFLRETVAVAAGGAAPPQMMTLIEQGLAGGSPQTIQRAGKLVRALEADPRAFNTLGGIEPRQRAALVRASTALDGGAEPGIVMQQFAADMKQQAGPLDMAMQRLGKTDTEQAENLATLVDRLVTHHTEASAPGFIERNASRLARVATLGLHEGAADWHRRATMEQDAFVPPALKLAIRERVLTALPQYERLGTWTLNPFGTNALETALQKETRAMLTTEWGRSGVATQPGSPPNRVQWTQGAPEQRYSVPDPSGTPSIEWLQPFVHRTLATQGLAEIDGKPVRELRFGRDLTLVPAGRDADGEWRYQIKRLHHSTWVTINAVGPEGEGTTPLTLRLAEEAKELRERRRNRLERERQERFELKEFERTQ